MGLGAVVGVVAPVVIKKGLELVVDYGSQVAGDHTTWNALQNTHDETIKTSEEVAKKAFGWMGDNFLGRAVQSGAGYVGNLVGRAVAPSVTLSPDSMQAAKQAGDLVKQGVKMTGTALLDREKDNNWKLTAGKATLGLMVIGAGMGVGAIAPEVAIGLAAQSAVALGVGYLMNKDNKPAENKTAENAAPEKKADAEKVAASSDKALTPEQIEAKLKKIEEYERKKEEFLSRPEVQAYKLNAPVRATPPKTYKGFVVMDAAVSAA